jgi:hypothetical protein
VSPEIAARLASLQIEMMAEAKAYCVFARGECVAIVQRQDGSFSVGSSGVMTDHGLAYLVWRDDRPLLLAHGGNEIRATHEQVEVVRRFSTDLKAALGLAE